MNLAEGSGRSEEPPNMNDCLYLTIRSRLRDALTEGSNDERRHTVMVAAHGLWLLGSQLNGRYLQHPIILPQFPPRQDRDGLWP